MADLRSLVHGQKALAALVRGALARGWQVSRTAGGHLKFSKPGFMPVYTSSTPGDHRAVRNARALLRRRERGEG